ncbi:MAG: ArsR family transcriptional regulator [Spirochaetaceae bacterium]|nr:MAG: ArsR family transcriptional regulator [Spirochaetaceae bacterium]
MRYPVVLMESHEHSIELFAHVFRALSDETRLRIVRLLLHADAGLCVCELVSALELPQYQVSRHLGVLKTAGLVRVERKGTWSYYRMAYAEQIDPLIDGLTRSFEPLTSDYPGDLQRLDSRLSLRADGLCVVGFVESSELQRSPVSSTRRHQ